MAKPSVLMIEDDPDIRELVAFNLGKEGYVLTQAANAEDGLRLCSASCPDLVLLDVMLPGIDGLEAIRRIRAMPTMKAVPIIMMTARGEDADIVSALELGADDYVTKPFSPRVLTARIRAALRRASPSPDPDPHAKILAGHGMSLDQARHEFHADGSRVELSATEFSILALLMGDPGRVFTRGRIIDEVKGHDYPVTDRAVDVQIVSLRRKLGSRGDCIETVRGVGYRLKDEP